MVGQPRRPEILLIVNRTGWTQDFKAVELMRLLSDDFRFVRRLQTEVSEADVARADLAVVFFWRQFLKMPGLARTFHSQRRKMLIGICSHFALEGDLRRPGLSAIHRFGGAVFANNRLLEREFRPLLRLPVHYTPNGVDTERFRPARAPEQSGRMRVGWAGSLGNLGPEQRGFYDLIVPAVERVAGAELVAANREERWRPHHEMVEFYQGLDVYLCASRHEGTPNPCLEAAACGVPVVTPRIGNMPELIEHGRNGLFVERSVADIAAKLALLRDDPALRARLGRNLRTSILAWDWKIQVENYRRMFRAALAQPAPLGRSRLAQAWHALGQRLAAVAEPSRRT